MHRSTFGRQPSTPTNTLSGPTLFRTAAKANLRFWNSSRKLGTAFSISAPAMDACSRWLNFLCGKMVVHETEAVALDFSPAMIEAARKRFAGDSSVTVMTHNLDRRLPALGKFDAVISSFAIHHVVHERKRELYAEIHGLLNPGGVFCNLEHVASPTPRLHAEFLEHIGFTVETEDPSNKLLDVETQLQWLREIGFVDVDCHWKWRELALLAGRTS